MPTLLEPPGITPDTPEYETFNPLTKKYYTDPDELLRRYKDPDRLASIITYLEQKVFDNGTEIAEIKSTLIDIKNQINRVDSRLREVKPIDKPYMTGDAPLNIVERSGWGAMKMQKGMKILKHPITKVNFTFNTGTESCDDPEKCAKLIKKIQVQDMKKGLPDIAYNFLVAEDGNVYEGRGWHLSPAIADTDPKYEENTVDVAFAGNYQSDSYPFQLFEVAVDLINHGIEKSFVSENYNML